MEAGEELGRPLDWLHHREREPRRRPDQGLGTPRKPRAPAQLAAQKLRDGIVGRGHRRSHRVAAPEDAALAAGIAIEDRMYRGRGRQPSCDGKADDGEDQSERQPAPKPLRADAARIRRLAAQEGEDREQAVGRDEYRAQRKDHQRKRQENDGARRPRERARAIAQVRLKQLLPMAKCEPPASRIEERQIELEVVKPRQPADEPGVHADRARDRRELHAADDEDKREQRPCAASAASAG